MSTYTAEIVLYISDFSAESKDDAERVINEYLDTLGSVAPMNLTWPEVNYEVREYKEKKDLESSLNSAISASAILI